MGGDVLARLARGVVAQPVGEALSQRNGPLARPTLPSAIALTENNSNTATGSGLDHSPSVHALYQPTEPEVASRTNASQLESRTTALGPSA